MIKVGSRVLINEHSNRNLIGMTGVIWDIRPEDVATIKLDNGVIIHCKIDCCELWGNA